MSNQIVALVRASVACQENSNRRSPRSNMPLDNLLPLCWPALMHGAIVLHKHPAVASFSKADITTATMQQVAEMRVVDEVFSYTMKPPKSGWNKNLWEKKIAPVMQKHEAKVMGLMIDGIVSGKISEAQFQVHYQHEVCRRTAKETGMIYRRRRRKRE